jgi:hypothetical protein
MYFYLFFISGKNSVDAFYDTIRVEHDSSLLDRIVCIELADSNTAIPVLKNNKFF